MEEMGLGLLTAFFPCLGVLHLPQHSPSFLADLPLQLPCGVAPDAAEEEAVDGGSLTRNLSLEWQTAHSPA